MRILFMAGMLWGTVFAQTAPRLAFEVASVKPSSPDDRMVFRLQPGGRYIATAVTLKTIVANAWGAQEFSIRNAPAWGGSQKFNIEAKVGIQLKPWPDSTSQLSEMLQSLLEDRFRFAFHRETRQETVYELVIAKGGAKLAAAKEGESPGFGTEPGRMHSMAVPLSIFTATLGDVMGRQVIDKTGLSGKFDFTLTWTPDTAAPGDDGPSIFTAIEQQLGLKLESTKAPVNLLVIDHAEKPSEN